jgi:hypothetical protein
VPYLGLLVVFHPLLRRIYDYLRPIPTNGSRQNGKANGTGQVYISATEAEYRMNQRASFDFGFALLFMAALHGFSSLKVLLILFINYTIATNIPKRYIPAATWIFNIGMLFANELCDGYKYANIAEVLSTWAAPVALQDGAVRNNWGSKLDEYGGLLSRWEISFNITVLRLISFNMDYYWSLDRRSGSPIEVKWKLRRLPVFASLTDIRRSN